MALETGAKLGRYEIVDRLGQGGMAAVYKAHDPSLDRVVALKVIRTDLTEDADFLERFRREARAVARLDHPHIVQVFEFAEANGMPFLAMQYLEGGTLKQRVGALASAGTRMPHGEAVAILAQVADALAYAHARGIVHRDVKPANVMLTSDGRAVVTDFGIAKMVSGTQFTQTGVGIGTPEYMSPEQGQGATVDARSDVYSLGVMAYEMLAGRLPFTADTPVAVVIKHMKDPLPAPSTVDASIGPQLEGAIVRALAKEPKDRFQSATELANALRAAVGQAGVTTPTIVVPRAAGAPSILGRLPLLAAAGAVLVLAAGGAVAYVQLGANGASATLAPGPTAAAVETARPTATVAAVATATPAPTNTPVPTATGTATPSPQPATPVAVSTPVPTPVPATPPPATPPPATPPSATIAPTVVPPTPTPTVTGPRSVVMEKATFSASKEQFGLIISNYPIGSEVVLVSVKHESGFEYQLNLRYSTNSNPYAIRFNWSDPTGKYTMRVTAAGTPYDLAFTVTQ